ncbi:MAG: LPS-assembly protein LptD [Bacteroidetes bacterium]|nr:LPS-assembly protein LptD [Bacteroidota bacterium]
MFLLFSSSAIGQNLASKDSLASKPITDSLSVKKDSTVKTIPKKSKFAFSSKVEYTAKDSIRFDIVAQKVYLYGSAEIKYENINLKASYVEISFQDNQIFAKGTEDSLGKKIGEPIFSEGSQTFNSKEITYNFQTKKGLIKQVITKQGENFLHGTTVKRLPSEEVNIKNGQFTTCDLEHPHYSIKFGKAKVIPDNKIVTGPAYLVIEDIPTPVALPFGFFPNKKGQRSGILMPTYGESDARGFYLENGGYYFGINDYLDLALRAGIFSRGSWSASASSNYNYKYHYSGNVNLSYAVNVIGEKGLPGYNKLPDFKVLWTHTQSPKARPNSRFSANVNAASNTYNQYNPSSTQDYITNTLSSNISYSTTIANSLNLSMNLGHSQNTLTKNVTVTLPTIELSANRFYPFRKREKVGALKWYDNISVGYNMNLKNTLSTPDSLLFTSESLNRFSNGMNHTVPISSTIKLLKYFNMTNSINLNESWYLKSIEKHWSNTYLTPNDTSYLRIDTINGFKAAHNFSFNSSISTRLYGMIQFKRGPIKAIRHVLSPSVGFNYAPDFSKQFWGFYKYYADSTYNPQLNNLKKYSIFEQSLYGSPPGAESGNISFAITNNLEMKVRSKKDTISGTKKIALIENFTISAGYDIAKDTCNWSLISMSGKTKLFQNLDLNYRGVWDPYVHNSAGTRINVYEWNQNKRIASLQNTSWQASFSYSLQSKKAKKGTTEKGSEQERNMIESNYNDYVDFNIPWSFNFNYNFSFYNDYKSVNVTNTIIQTLSFRGDINITPKWKIGFYSGYDFTNKQLSPTSVDIYRDLHCWEIRFNWIPIGARKSYNMTIGIKSAVLQDLKLTKKKDWRDY